MSTHRHTHELLLQSNNRISTALKDFMLLIWEEHYLVLFRESSRELWSRLSELMDLFTLVSILEHVLGTSK